LVLLSALFEKKTWRQAELADRAGLTSESVRRHMLELRDEGVPLEREEDGNQVYWSVPNTWGPAGVVIQSTDLDALLRIVIRHPKGATRDRLLARILPALPSPALWRRMVEMVSTGSESSDHRYLDVVEDAAAKETTLWMRYFSSHRGVVEARWISVQRVLPPDRLVAWCHRAEHLKWFRVDRIMESRMDPNSIYHRAAVRDVETYIGASIDGFAGQEPIRRNVFVVRAPDDRWVLGNLPFEADAVEPVADGTRISVDTHATISLARFVVGLGEAVHVETDELRELVTVLARGALAASAASGTTQTDVQSRPSTIVDGEPSDSESG